MRHVEILKILQMVYVRRMIPQGSADVTVVASTVGTAVLAALQWLLDLRCAMFCMSFCSEHVLTSFSFLSNDTNSLPVQHSSALTSFVFQEHEVAAACLLFKAGGSSLSVLCEISMMQSRTQLSYCQLRPVLLRRAQPIVIFWISVLQYSSSTLLVYPQPRPASPPSMFSSKPSSAPVHTLVSDFPWDMYSQMLWLYLPHG